MKHPVYCNFLLPSHPCLVPCKRSVINTHKKNIPMSLCGRKPLAPEFPELSCRNASAIKINECLSLTSRSVRSSSADRWPSDLQPSTRKGARILLKWWGVVLQRLHTFFWLSRQFLGRDSSLGMANHYGLDCPRIESRWGRGILYPSRLPLRPTHPLVR
jgi:hypothetical protein